MHEEAEQVFDSIMNAEIATGDEEVSGFRRHVPPAVFFDRLYYPRAPVEIALRMHLKDPSVLTSFEGVEGAGKSTTLLRVLSDMSQEEYPALLVDFNEMYNEGIFRRVHDQMMWEAEVDRRISNMIISRHFEGGSPARMLDLYCAALFGRDERTKAKYINYSAVVKRLHRPFAGIERDIEQWFVGHVYQSDSVGKELAVVIGAIQTEATAADYIRALVYRGRIPALRHFVVVFDNADAIPKEYQPHCWGFALAASMSLAGSAKCVVCVRPENAHLPPDEPACNRRVPCRLSLGTYHQEASESRLTAADLNEIIAKRQEFFAENTPDQQYVRATQLLAATLKDPYVETMLIDLANQSLRAALHYHCSFIQYLLSYYPVARLGDMFGLRLWDSEVPLPTVPKGWSTNLPPERRGLLHQMLNSCLRGWVADTGKVLDAQCLDVVDLVLRCERGGYRVKGCDLSYLVLARLFNHAGPLTVAELTKDLGALRFEPQDVRKVIAALYGLRTEDFGYVIQITNDERLKDAEDLRDDTEVEVNLRGRTLLHHITPSFTFVNRSLIRHGEYRYTGGECYYALSNVVAHSLANIRLFARVAVVHMIELTRIASKMDATDWYGRYSRLYCIDGELQLARMLGSSAVFLESVRTHSESEAQRKTLGLHIACLRTLKGVYNLDVQRLVDRRGACVNYGLAVQHMLERGPRVAREYLALAEYFCDIGGYVREELV